MAGIKIGISVLHVIISLYIPFLTWRKTPTQRDLEAAEIWHKKGYILYTTVPERGPEVFIYFKWLTGFDLTKFDFGAKCFADVSVTFSFGFSLFRLSKKVLDFVNNKINHDDIKNMMNYEFSERMHNWLSGDWKKQKKYDDNIVNQYIKISEIQKIAYYLNQNAFTISEQGDFLKALELLDKMYEIGNLYDSEHVKSCVYPNYVKLLMKYRRFDEAIIKADTGIDFSNKLGETVYLFSTHSFKARTQIIMGDLQGSESSLHNAGKYRISMPFHLTDFLTSQFLYDICLLEQGIKDGNNSEVSEYRKKAIKSGKGAVNISRKAASDRVEIFKLMGVYYWLINKQKKAMKWWNESIKEGERLGARLELSRTYFEIGKRLRTASETSLSRPHGLSAEEYLEKARVMFEEMDLQWDLEQLEKIASSS